MSKFFDEVLEVLKADGRFYSDDETLMRNAVYEAAMKMDPILIKALYKKRAVRARLFTDVDGIAVFDKVGFGWIVNSKSFLPDSYTRYKNKIGLVNQKEELLSGTKDVEIVFPYKDCVLEGGQTKEDQKRSEIFYNKLLASEEVDRLLSPKAFTAFKKYSAQGEVLPDGFDQDDNLLIKGNNLLAISSLLKRFEGKINCIYIDPPFNTGKDSFSYNDHFTRSAWLTFMINRLEIAKRLLAPDGNIFIHIDINQSHYLKVLADEVFLPENFVEEIIWAYGSPSGGRTSSPKPVNVHDYILHYAKNYAQRKQRRVYIPYSDKYIEEWFKYEDEDGRKYQRRQRDSDESGNPIWVKQYLDESKGVPLSTVWNDIHQVYADPRAYKKNNKADVEVIKEFTGGQKPEALIQRILEISTDPGDLVLDFHLGTGTTAAAAMKMKRQFIGVEQIQSQIDITIRRLKKVIAGDKAGISKNENWTGGGSFCYLELKTLNQQYVNQIETATETTIDELWEQIRENAFVCSYVEPLSLRQTKSDFDELALNEKKRLLMDLLDLNQLYVNYCDMADDDYGMSKQDLALTKAFYASGD